MNKEKIVQLISILFSLSDQEYINKKIEATFRNKGARHH